MGNSNVKVVPLVEKKHEKITVIKKYSGDESIDCKVEEFISACYNVKSNKRNTLFLLNSKIK